MWNQWIQAMYPDKCLVCHQLLSRGQGDSVCRKCRGELRLLTEPRCKHCSKPLEEMEQEYCGDCCGRKSKVEYGVALYLYDRSMQKAIRNFKYYGELAVGRYFASKITKHYGDWIRQIAPDVLIPIPIHKKRKRFRGFNQAEYLAHLVGEELGISVSGEYLVRTENTKPQKALDVNARMKNLQKGFAVNGEAGAYETVVLVDDIYTTGATIEACAGVLQRNGIKRIYFLCVCIGRGD